MCECCGTTSNVLLVAFLITSRGGRLRSQRYVSGGRLCEGCLAKWAAKGNGFPSPALHASLRKVLTRDARASRGR